MTKKKKTKKQTPPKKPKPNFPELYILKDLKDKNFLAVKDNNTAGNARKKK